MPKFPLFPFLIALFFLAGCNKPASPQKTEESLSSTAQRVVPKTAAVQKSYAGPFGLAPGMSLKELKELGFKESPNVADTFRGLPPRPVDGIDAYTIVAAPKTGLCRITAVVFISTADSSGQELRDEVDSLSEIAEIKYGEPSKTVPFRKVVIGKNMPSWMARLADDSVNYGYGWRRGETAIPMPEELYTVEVKAGAANEAEGYAMIRYTYKNFDDCQGEFAERKAADL